ncbi:hypothetical protein DPMN_191842 [Dreissena polymorpha]|uniref:Uncharacterized protein n=1 Tax=Dreissena polymorpha TaxID=45954 RepID=A0A9D4BCS5_DREPO|nr:hypothetical protein DPMN_191842 [Dreissena polymorpha]
MRISLATVTSRRKATPTPILQERRTADSLRAASTAARIFRSAQSLSDRDSLVAKSVQRLKAMVYQDDTVNCAVRTTDRHQIRYAS